MKRNSLPKGIIITSALLSTILMTTGCNTVQEVVDDYNPATQYEVDVYGPAPYIEDTEEENNEVIEEGTETKEQDTEINEQEKENKNEETNNGSEGTEEIYEYDPSIGDATCDYGVIELVEPDSIGDIDTNGAKSSICVYGPPEKFEGDN